ncbi:MAG: hypothetical protein KKH11_05310, partial [Candidatus Omnitrophica bacterium]|nr:hypothetical protein [Candidatus Omnitrophota bacterium]
KKGIKVEDTIKAFDLCHRLGIMTHAFLMIGAPDETEQDLLKTCQMLKRIKPYSWRLLTVTPVPGSAIFDDTINKDSTRTIDYACSDALMNNKKNIIPLKLKFLTKGKIIEYSKKIHRICILVNIKRILGSWHDFKLAIKYSKWAFNKIFNNY